MINIWAAISTNTSASIAGQNYDKRQLKNCELRNSGIITKQVEAKVKGKIYD